MSEIDSLRDALIELNTARGFYHSRQDAVWREVQVIAPLLAARLRQFGFDDRAAAEWVCQLGGHGASPADDVLAGRLNSVLAWLERGIEGFVG